MAGYGSKDRYPKASNGKNGKIPSAEANASNGDLVGPGSSSSYPNPAKGNTTPAPRDVANASDGAMGGKGSPTTYPKGKMSYPTDMNGGTCKEGKDQFSPKGGQKL